jgi:dTDP-4-dehydrorhamnose 3,5-epimerase
MKIETTAIFEVKILIPERFGDQRGFFCESWNEDTMEKSGLDYKFVQDNHSLSVKEGTVRGLHFQSPPHAQAKLVRCGQGSMFDVAVDFRNGSPTFGHWVGVELSAANGKQLLIPAGFLHGFATRSANTEIIYKCTDYYAPECDRTVKFDDPDIGIDWGLKGMPILSSKDANAPFFKDIKSPFSWVAED